MAFELSKLQAHAHDTTPELFRRYCDIWRQFTPTQRLRKTFDLIETLEKTAKAGIRRRHPEYTDEQVRMALIRIRLGDDLFRTVYPGVEVMP